MPGTPRVSDFAKFWSRNEVVLHLGRGRPQPNSVYLRCVMKFARDLANKQKALATRYGISIEEVQTIQTSPCGICGSTEKIEIDHDHKTGKVRGALCRFHNQMVGFLEKSSLEEIQKLLIWVHAPENKVVATSGESQSRAGSPEISPMHKDGEPVPGHVEK